MGVPGFSTWLKRQYPEAFQHITQKQSFDHVYVDLPSTLHVVTRKARSKNGLHHLLHARLDDLLRAAAPKQRLVLALDGPAPLAKLLEQRRRRRREAEKTIRDAAEAAAATGGGKQTAKKSSELSTLSLTTGTLLMLELHQSLAYYICNRLSNPAYQHLRFELSDSTVKGEGELKILSRLLHRSDRAPARSEASSAAPPPGEGSPLGGGAYHEETHLVVGGDSDLLLMVMISGQRGVTVCDDAHDMGRSRGRSKHGAPVAFVRDVLEETWRREHLGAGSSQADVTNMALDLTLLAIMSHGNDYLPGCPSLLLSNKQRQGVWNLYLDMRRRPEWEGQWLVTRTCICTDATGAPAPQTAKSSAKCTSTGPAVQLNYGMVAALLELYERCNQPPRKRKGAAAAPTARGPSPVLAAGVGDGDGASASEPESDAECEGDVEDVRVSSSQGRMPVDLAGYVRGLEWVLGMYSSGSVQDYRFTYFGSPPTPAALLTHFRQRASAAASCTDSASADADATAGLTDTPPGAVPGASSGAEEWLWREPLTPAACALALLPARGRRHAASALRHLMDADSPVAEIYAVCHECRANGDKVRTVSREFDTLRQELAALQAKLAAAPLDADGAYDTAGDLLGAVERCEGALITLRKLMAELSRSQQEHQARSHPPKPFPTDELEAAVASVPLADYPRWERRLARFGREMVYSWQPEPPPAASGLAVDSAASAAEVEEIRSIRRPRDSSRQGDDQPVWLSECLSFASNYPRLADREGLRATAARVSRRVLPLHPYMQPPRRLHRVQHDRTVALNTRPFALVMRCQVRADFLPQAASMGAVARLATQAAGAPGRRASAIAVPPRPAVAGGLQTIARCAQRLLPRLRAFGI